MHLLSCIYSVLVGTNWCITINIHIDVCLIAYELTGVPLAITYAIPYQPNI